MRHSRRLLGAALLVLLPAAAGPPRVEAADLRIGYIDSARIFQEYKPAQDAQQQFDRQVQSWRNESAEKQKAVDALRAEVRDQAPILSALKLQEKEEALQRAISDYERFVQDIWGPQGRAVQENERATAEIVTAIRASVEKIARDKDLELVLDAAGGYIVWADHALDITPAVLDDLANQAQSAAPH